jgi:MerR family redox-sensitive transcriptional activator SoxR
MAPDTLTIGEIASRSGLAASAIRFYEQSGLLPKPIRRGGQRRYTSTVLDQLTVLQHARRSGFTLPEIRGLFHGFREGEPFSVRWQEAATRKIAELDLQMQQIALMKNMLEQAVKCRCIELEECGRAMRNGRGTIGKA